MSQLNDKILITDIFDELRQENSRLLTELEIAKKCIEFMENYRKHLLNLIIDNNCECNPNINKLLIQNLEKDRECVFSNKQVSDNNKNNNKTKDKSLISNKQSVKKSNVNELHPKPEKYYKSVEVKNSDSNGDEDICNKSKFKASYDYSKQEVLQKVRQKEVVIENDPKNQLISAIRLKNFKRLIAYKCNICKKIVLRRYIALNHLGRAHLKAKPLNACNYNQTEVLINQENRHLIDVENKESVINMNQVTSNTNVIILKNNDSNLVLNKVNTISNLDNKSNFRASHDFSKPEVLQKVRQKEVVFRNDSQNEFILAIRLKDNIKRNIGYRCKICKTIVLRRYTALKHLRTSHPNAKPISIDNNESKEVSNEESDESIDRENNNSFYDMNEENNDTRLDDNQLTNNDNCHNINEDKSDTDLKTRTEIKSKPELLTIKELKHEIERNEVIFEVDSKNKLISVIRRKTGHKFNKKLMIGYKCNECDAIRLRRYSIVKHLNIKHSSAEPLNYSESNDTSLSKKSFNCDECAEHFGSKIILIEHKKNVHNWDSFDNRRERFPNKEELMLKIDQQEVDFGIDPQIELITEIRLKTNQRIIGYRCNCCQLLLLTKDSIVNHVNINHLNERPFGCDKCNAKYASKYNLWRHKRETHLLKKLECDWPGCMFETKFKNAMKRHLMRHKGDHPFSCQWPGCDWFGLSVGEVNSHMKRKHCSNNDKPFACDWPGCDWTFKVFQALKSHKRSHTGEKPYKCDWPQCDKSFGYLAGLNRHIASHAGNWKFRCVWPACDKVCLDRSHLNRHVQSVHQNIRPFQCEWNGCGMRFGEKGNMNKHMRTHINGRKAKKLLKALQKTKTK